MKCFFCSTEKNTTEEAIAEGWIPSFWIGGHEELSPVCVPCAEKNLSQLVRSGEWEMKAEKIEFYFVPDEATERQRGEILIRLLGLRVNGNGRVDTSVGDKTALGLFRTVRSVIFGRSL